MNTDSTRCLFIFSILFLSLNSYALEREEMIEYFLDYEEIETLATDVMDDLKNQLIASDKKITNANFDEIYRDVFEDYRESYISANAKAYEVYSDQELQALYDFYQSDFGDWYRQAEKDFGPRVRENMSDATDTLQIAISQLRRKKRNRK